jgi:hypothetical protein
MDFFFIFWPSKIRVSPTVVVSFLSPPRCHLSSDRHRHAGAPCHASFPLSKDELATSASSSGNALCRCLPSRAETEVLNSHHRRRLPSSDPLLPHFIAIKKIISTLTTLPITQPRLYFVSSLTRAPHHRSSTHRCRSLSSLSYAHHLSTQRHPR